MIVYGARRYSTRRRFSLFFSPPFPPLFFSTLPFCTPGKTALERFLWESGSQTFSRGENYQRRHETWGIFIKIITTLPGARVRVCLALLRKEMRITRGLLFFDALTFYFFLRAKSFPCRPIKRPLVKPVLTRWKNGSRVISVVRGFFLFFFLFSRLYFVKNEEKAVS